VPETCEVITSQGQITEGLGDWGIARTRHGERKTQKGVILILPGESFLQLGFVVSSQRQKSQKGVVSLDAMQSDGSITALGKLIVR